MGVPTKSTHGPQKQSVEVHREAILDPGLSLPAKAVYVAVLLESSISTVGLSRLLHVGRGTIAAHLKELERAGWTTRTARRMICPAQPRQVRERKVERFRKMLPLTPYTGEFISFSWLDELVDSDEYVDHARPSFLRNPVTRQPMEYDRIYPSYRKAFEHQGLQHFGPTDKFPDPVKAREQELRDWAKLGLSTANGIELVTITYEDLSLKGMWAKIPDGLPKRAPDPEDPYIQCLEQESAKYRALMHRIRREQPAREE